MGWADNYIAKLKRGETVEFRPRGNSMSGKIQSGDLVTVQPVTEKSQISKNDIVLCKVSGNQYLHLVKAMFNDRYLIANNHGRVNGWIPRENIYGEVTRIE